MILKEGSLLPDKSVMALSARRKIQNRRYRIMKIIFAEIGGMR
jgi:hypothetical protein